MPRLVRIRRLAAIAQNGLTFARDPFDRERYAELRAVAAELLADATAAAPDDVLATFRVENGYATPKIDVRAVVFDDEGRLLFVRERLDGDRWTLPGGWADVGDAPSTAVEREVREESGYEVRATKVLALYDRDAPRHGHPRIAQHAWKVLVRCELLGGAAAASVETTEPTFFDEAQTAMLQLSTDRTTPAQIALAFADLRDPRRPTEFD